MRRRHRGGVARPRARPGAAVWRHRDASRRARRRSPRARGRACQITLFNLLQPSPPFYFNHLQPSFHQGLVLPVSIQRAQATYPMPAATSSNAFEPSFMETTHASHDVASYVYRAGLGARGSAAPRTLRSTRPPRHQTPPRPRATPQPPRRRNWRSTRRITRSSATPSPTWQGRAG
jgi:hypothetical protein